MQILKNENAKFDTIYGKISDKIELKSLRKHNGKLIGFIGCSDLYLWCSQSVNFQNKHSNLN